MQEEEYRFEVMLGIPGEQKRGLSFSADEAVKVHAPHKPL